MKNPIVWDDVHVAVVAAAAGTQSGAAQRLNLSVATVGRRLDRLETALGLRLFQRHANGLSPTPEAEEVLARAQGLGRDMDALMRAATAGSKAAEGDVTVSTIETIAAELIAPRLARLRRRHPRLNVVLRSTTQVVNLDRGAADLAVRVVRPNESRVVGRKLGTLSYGLYASREYLGDRAVDALRLDTHDVVMFDEAWDDQPEMVWLAERMAGNVPAFRVTTASAMHRLVAGGGAVGLLPTIMGQGLVGLAVGAGLPSRDVWLVLHEDLRQARPVRAVADFLVEVFAEALSPTHGGLSSPPEG
ncbi:MAG: LysR family transcriptional regulator [Myxococcota bacterium]